MELPGAKNRLVEKLQREILFLQGCKAPADEDYLRFGLGALEASFPGGVLPTGAVHEFWSAKPEDAAATTGFMAGLLGKIMQRGGVALWIAPGQSLFPPALKWFGVEPDRVLFVDIRSGKDLLWTLEEALKCRALTAVVGELKEVDLAVSRRLQLAVEQSRVTGFLHRHSPQNRNALAAAARWQITPLASRVEDSLPGVGHYRWQVELLKVRNGQPGTWGIEWKAGDFSQIGIAEATGGVMSRQKTA